MARDGGIERFHRDQTHRGHRGNLYNDLRGPAFDAGVLPDPHNSRVTLFTAGGNVKAKLGIAASIRVGHAERDDVRVVIHSIPNLPEGVDGLLGLSFFDRFMVRLDHSQQELHLTPKSS